jgi:hypothetical protein
MRRAIRVEGARREDKRILGRREYPRAARGVWGGRDENERGLWQ